MHPTVLIQTPNTPQPTSPATCIECEKWRRNGTRKKEKHLKINIITFFLKLIYSTM